ncbi:hypothetical protein [Paenibacillus eucommiae]|uniref:Uncharacterized protein n=1 Tax=Paenibacillus eucommiae TaxID=1355755 RepID=A0ABS4J076_9BACL|nr:hypothetical protein [Paenibacillus eucommiae]MBP1993243.1 hypothetical protein [Paenibacillus eucommiae]
MDYKPAELNPNLINQLEAFEDQLREQTSENIIVIAYQSDSDTNSEGGSAQKENR